MANTMVSVDRCGAELNECLNRNSSYEYFVKHHVHGNRTHAFIEGYLFRTNLYLIPNKKNWWRSENIETEEFSNKYSGVLTSRNWILNEVNLIQLNIKQNNKELPQEFGILLLRLQQCGLTTNEIRWENWTPKEETSDAKSAGKKI